jgi:dihydroorotase
MKILIRNGRVIDPANNRDEQLDILVEGGRISRVAKNIRASSDELIEAKDKIVIPGLVDMHVHLREPGREDKETVASATAAGLKGGVTSLLAMPNTEPAIDSPSNVRLLTQIIKKTSRANVFIAGTITKGRLGRELADLAGLKKEGALAITDDGVSVDDEELFLRALRAGRQQGLLVICHCEDKVLAGKGVVNRGIIATRLGLRGIPNEAEYKRLERDIALAKKTGARLHIAHVSCRESVAIIAQAKKEGVKVTAETCPHYFALSEESVLGYDTNFKMNPPLRSKADVEAIRFGLKSGAIDVIASDHAPHTENEKDIEFDRAEFGVIGLETELAVGISELIAGKVLDWSGLVRKLSLNPAQILGIAKGTLAEGKDADIVIIDPEREWAVKKEELLSKSKNSAFLGKKVRGVVTQNICSGKLAYESEK